MERPDLAALTPDDLGALANRGLVKRAQKEVDTGEFTAAWTESEDGTITAAWSDGPHCVLPGGKTLKDARCDCPALDLCRHLLRTVLAWQARRAGAGDAEPPVAEAWNPARMSDALIEAQAGKTARDRAETLWNQGILAELLVAVKPSARFHCPGHTVRFPVPDDLRYAHCSCSDPAPCPHAVLAARAFRLLPEGDTSGIVSAGQIDAPADPEPLDSGADCVRELFRHGLSSLAPAWRDRLRRVSAASLPWPAQILEELAEDYDRYAARDAGFSPESMLLRAGEYLLRGDAILAPAAPVPQAFIRGQKADRDTEIGSARFIGLGATVIESRAGTALHVYLQELDSGHAVTVTREFAEPPGTPRKTCHQLARTSAVKDASLASLAAGQLVTQGGKRTAAGRLVIGRARAVVNPQNFAWEQLKAPLLVEDFAEIAARLRLLPPACFRPRRAGSDFHVCPLQAIEGAHFDPGANAIVAALVDPAGNRATLIHPWTERGAGGAESLLAELQSGAAPVFVAGHVSPGIVFRPTALVFAGENARRAVLPWIGEHKTGATGPRSGLTSDPRVYAEATELLTALLLQGAARLAQRDWPGWERGIADLEATGHRKMAAWLQEIRNQEAAVLPAVKWWRLGMEIQSD
ncbi:MAG: hypothetical protein JNK37_08730 [Verrucomicrobiales bacterium]|nr:hypothetical protein [Verrucomicrobiales bacterium]